MSEIDELSLDSGESQPLSESLSARIESMDDVSSSAHDSDLLGSEEMQNRQGNFTRSDIEATVSTNWSSEGSRSALTLDENSEVSVDREDETVTQGTTESDQDAHFREETFNENDSGNGPEENQGEGLLDNRREERDGPREDQGNLRDTGDEGLGNVIEIQEQDQRIIQEAPGEAQGGDLREGGAEAQRANETEETGRATDPEAEEPPAKVMKMDTSARSDGSDDGDGETCPICLERWASAGTHRLVALKCGHLFGAACVERWLRGRGVKERACPTCKTRAALRDVRPLYARRLVAADAAELGALRRRADELAAERDGALAELAAERLERRKLALQLDALRRGAAPPAGPRPRDWRFALERNLELRREGGCRVLAFNSRTCEFYASQRSASALFPGYGVRAVGGADGRPGAFVHLHPKAIRDAAYSRAADLLLTVGLDGSARAVRRGAPAAVVRVGVPLWSCAWDRARDERLYVGALGGAVLRYDLRHAAAPLDTLEAPADRSPVVALRSTEFGLLACQLNSCRLWSGEGAAAEATVLATRGPLASLCYDEPSRRAAVVCRGAEGARAHLALFSLGAREGRAAAERAGEVGGSARSVLMARAAWVRGGAAVWLAHHSEAEGALLLHAVEGARSVSLPASEPALDVCAGPVGDRTVLAALSDSRLRLYSAVPVPS